jgi:hypothetical protein
MNSAIEQEIDFQKADRARLQQLLAMSVNDPFMSSQIEQLLKRTSDDIEKLHQSLNGNHLKRQLGTLSGTVLYMSDDFDRFNTVIDDHDQP